MTLAALLAALDPALSGIEVVFCTLPRAELKDVLRLEPMASFAEPEGLSLIIRKDVAERQGIRFTGSFRGITLRVLSDLEDVGLTAAVAARLAQHDISANVVAACHHDHVFVPSRNAECALQALRDLQAEAASGDGGASADPRGGVSATHSQ